MKTIRGPRGLGDSIYLRPIVDHLLARGEALRLFCDYPDIFRGAAVDLKPFTRQPRADIVAHYVNGKDTPGTNQFQDMCLAAGIKEQIPQRFDWAVTNHTLADDVRALAGRRRVILVHGGCIPMDRTDGFGAELLPQEAAFRAVLEQLVDEDCFLVRIGRKGKGGGARYVPRADIDLYDRTSVSDLLDLAATCDGAVGQVSYVIPLAEAFGKPLLVVWASRGRQAPHGYVRSIMPPKVLSGPASSFVFDNHSIEDLRAGAGAWARAMQ
jgi:hypothetical protein